ncbi:MAG: GNAT family N-acetyltransferase [Fimbriimonadaceae bacterium]|nr:GNAT family N-acetyltransferase [Fimbriimonadaceae bacterium]
MRRSFVNADFDRMAELWNEVYPAAYAITPELLRAKTVDCPRFDWGASSMVYRDAQVIAFMAIKKSAAPLYRVSDADQYHLHSLAYREPSAAGELLADARRMLRDRGGSRLVFGQDAAHLFPGCPTDCAKLREFLEIEGFIAGTEVVDLERDLADFRLTAEFAPGDIGRPLVAADAPELDEFLAREFPGRWHYDVQRTFESEGPDYVYGLFAGTRLIGFAVIQDSRVRVPMGGAVWHVALGPNWGSLGPIGVARDARGHGRGLTLLTAALGELRQRGARQTIIDWTTLVEFYGKVGFSVTRRYVPMTLGLSG